MFLTPTQARRQSAGMIDLATELRDRMPGALRGLLAELRARDGSAPAQTYDREVKSPNRSTFSSTEAAAFGRTTHERRRQRLGAINTQLVALLNEALGICDAYVPEVDVKLLTCTGFERKCVRIVPPERRAAGLCDACRMAKSRALRSCSNVPAQ